MRQRFQRNGQFCAHIQVSIMLSLWSDIIGIASGFLLMLPAAKDNLYRFFETTERQKKTKSPWPGLRVIVADVWKQKRDSYSALDTLLIALGGVGLMISFALKLGSH